nr:brain-specific homeobox protein homolog [Penaeus vannamei]
MSLKVIFVACVAAVALADKAPVHHLPPVYAAPTYHAPRPVYHAPRLAYHAPRPAYHAPAHYEHHEYPTVRPRWLWATRIPIPVSPQRHVPYPDTCVPSHHFFRRTFETLENLPTLIHEQLFSSMKFIKSRTRLQLNVMLHSITNSTLKEW